MAEVGACAATIPVCFVSTALVLLQGMPGRNSEGVDESENTGFFFIPCAHGQLPRYMGGTSPVSSGPRPTPSPHVEAC